MLYRQHSVAHLLQQSSSSVTQEECERAQQLWLGTIQKQWSVFTKPIFDEAAPVRVSLPRGKLALQSRASPPRPRKSTVRTKQNKSNKTVSVSPERPSQLSSVKATTANNNNDATTTTTTTTPQQSIVAAAPSEDSAVDPRLLAYRKAKRTALVRQERADELRSPHWRGTSPGKGSRTGNKQHPSPFRVLRVSTTHASPIGEKAVASSTSLLYPAVGEEGRPATRRTISQTSPHKTTTSVRSCTPTMRLMVVDRPRKGAFSSMVQFH